MPGIETFEREIYNFRPRDGSPAAEWLEGTSAARRAFYEAASDRHEVAELAAAAFGGPIRFAERLRQTDFGAKGSDPAWSRDEYVAHIFGEDATFGDAYSSALLYAWQSVAPFVASVH